MFKKKIKTLSWLIVKNTFFVEFGMDTCIIFSFLENANKVNYVQLMEKQI